MLGLITQSKQIMKEITNPGGISEIKDKEGQNQVIFNWFKARFLVNSWSIINKNIGTKS